MIDELQVILMVEYVTKETFHFICKWPAINLLKVTFHFFCQHSVQAMAQNVTKETFHFICKWSVINLLRKIKC